MYAKGKNSKQSIKKLGNRNKHGLHDKAGKKNVSSVQKQSYKYSDYERSSSTSSPESSLERRPKERASRSRTRRTGKSTQPQSTKSPNKHNGAPNQGESKSGKSTTLNVLGNSKSYVKIFPSKSYSVGQSLSFLKSKSAFRTGRKRPGKSVSFKTNRMSSGKTVNNIKRTSSGNGVYRHKLSKGMKRLEAKTGRYDSRSKMAISGLVKDGDIHKLPCGESGKWKYIRMYQERARRREARKRRQRQKQREEASGKKSTRRRKRSRRKSKSKRSRSRSRRRKSTSRKSSPKSKRRRRRRS